MAWGSGWGYYEEDEADYDKTEPTEAEVFKRGEWPFGVKGKATDIPLPKDAVCAQISNVLARAEGQAGEFSFGGQADTLPVAPGLSVKGVGTIALPLCKAQAEELIAKCNKSPFGKKLDTMMDEKVRKSWQLSPDQVSIKNPQWGAGIDQLRETIASRLGYKGVPMQCKLYKLLVYGKGGHFVKHQDTEKEDGMVATLVVQLPSEHEGGDLVVYQGGKEVQRHDFGKRDGTAAFLPHYAVHYADAEHALEKVKKGFRLVLIYSICLPPTMRHLLRNHDKPLSEELAGLIGQLKPKADSFSLLLSHEYTDRSIQDLGTRALKGIDRARVDALEEANVKLPAKKKMQLYIVGMEHDISYYDTGGSWEENERDEKINWYSSTGQSYGQGMEEIKMNFLNPGRDTLAELWEGHGNSTFEGYLGNEGATRNTTYSRYTIVAWPAARSVENAMKYIGASAALGALRAQKSIDAATLRSFMATAANADLVEEDESYGSYSLGYHPKGQSVSVEFCQTLCELLVKVRDSALVNLFFTNFFGCLGEKEALLPSIVKIIRAFKWNDIGNGLLGSLDEEVRESNFGFMGYAREANDSGMKVALSLAKSLDDGTAQQELLNAAVEKAVLIRDECLCRSNVIGLLWMLAIRKGNKSILEPLANKVKKMEPAQLQRSIEILSQHVDGIAASDERFVVLASIVAVRIEWLKNYLKANEKPFSWEMPKARFPENAQIQAFLRGPNATATTKGIMTFNGLPDARKYATKSMRTTQTHASFTMEPCGRGKEAFVIVHKTRDWFSKYENSLLSYKDELKDLTDRFGGRVDGPAMKRVRVE